MSDLNQRDMRRSYPAHALFLLSSAAVVVLAWVTVVATVRGVWGILRFVIPGGVQ